VRAILTRSAARFVAPLTFEALTGHPVGTEVWDEQPGTSRMGHLELAHWAGVLVVAPATAVAIARLALGLADDLLGAVALSTRAPIVLAPAMESAMFTHPATQRHLATLVERGARIVGPERGRLASGSEGIGRMAEPASILDAVASTVVRRSDMTGMRVLVTAGPTREAIDPVRYIGNRSSGRMGWAIANAASRRGADVCLIAGPNELTDPSGVRVLRVESAAEMLRSVLDHVGEADAVVMSAAVADFRPSRFSDAKVKREGQVSLDLVPTEDIAAAAKAAAPEAIHIGFALETEDLIARAQEKRRRKGQDLVVGNSISDEFSPFGADRNRVVFVSEEEVRELPELPKEKIADLLWDEVVKRARR